MLHAVLFAAALSSGSLVADATSCNDIVAGQLQDQVRGFDRKRPSARAEQDQRMSGLQGVIDQVDEERDVVTHVCTEQSALTPILSDLDATAAWAMELQAETTEHTVGADCPAARASVESGFLAAAWARLMQATPADGKPSAYVTRLTNLFRERAALLALTLPARADATPYWVTSVEDKGRNAATDCQAAAPTATP